MQSIAIALKRLQVSWRCEFKSLSQIESMVFLAVASSPGIESPAIQEELDLDQPHASRILKKLIEKQFIRALILKKGDRKKAYFLVPQTGAMRLLNWIDGIIDELLVRNPVMLARFIAALEDAPDSVLERLDKGVLKVQQARESYDSLRDQQNHYDLAKRNRSDHGYRRLFSS